MISKLPVSLKYQEIILHSMDPALSPELGTNTTDREGAAQDDDPCGSPGLYAKGKAAFSWDA